MERKPFPSAETSLDIAGMRRARNPWGHLLAGVVMAVGLLVAWLFLEGPTSAGEKAKTKSVLLKVDVDFKDPALEYLLDEREISAKTLQAPMKLRFGAHELVVLRDSELVDVYHFEIGANTGAELALKRKEAQPGDDAPDFPDVMNLNPKAGLPTAPNRDEPRRKGEWIKLFNGKDLSGWRMRPQSPGGWHVENGILTCDEGRHGHLFTMEDDWTDVHLRMVVKAKNQGSGVCIRAPYNGTPANECYFLVIGGEKKKRVTGSLLVAGRDTKEVPKKAVPPDTWYTLEVIVKGHHVLTKINDKVVVDYEDVNKTYAKGYIILTHAMEKSLVHFKSIEVRDLAPDKLAARPAREVPPKSADHGQHAVHVIPLSDELAKKPVTPHLMMVRSPGGGFKLGWNDAKGRAHITTLDEGLKPVGDDVVVPETELRGLAVADDGTLLTLVFQAPCQMLALGLDPAGGEVFKTILSGERGSGPGTRFATHWFKKGKIVSAGNDFAVHYGHFNHLKGGAKHQGGCYARLDTKGKILQYKGWTVSHSVDQALFHHRGHFLTVSVGDAFPLGIPIMNRTYSAGSRIYPPKDQSGNFQPKATPLGSMFAVGDYVGLTFVTRVGESWHGYYAVTDTVGEVKHFVKILDKIPAKYSGMNAAPYGSGLLLIWTESEKSTRYAPIDSSGRFLAKPALVEEALGRRNDLAHFHNGDVGWLTALRGTNEVKLVRVKW